ncbi:F-box protein At4g18380 [Nicotiana tabacum]|uniref:F-box protein At4g18380 n=1 Tax=Nicotiana tabacum TaxID=4097 RepID=A0A1S3X694_TOBAC|nr:F-box protein At4g18380-like [Nicotiana tomentosiformis]XP_016435366.1 PREDICTED: F-box protein At4g18380-like [Nicotiana tabacum]
MSTIFAAEENEDLFDRLPDAIVLTIFDKVQDCKSLCIFSSLCKRFHSLITQTQNISLKIPPQNHHKSSNSNRNQLFRFFNRVFLKPFRFFLRQITKWNPICIPIPYTFSQKTAGYNCNCTCSYTSPAEILRNFSEIKQLDIRLAAGENIGLKNSDEPLLKWKAEFGSQLKHCLIVGGTSISPIHENHSGGETETESENFGIIQRGDSVEETLRMSNDELKLRIVWIISCLIAASTRHCLLEETIKEKKMLEKVAITDDIGQGICSMNCEQVEEMRRNTRVFSPNRSKVPALKVKMWYVPELELPAKGCTTKGATLVVIRPVEEWSKADDGRDLVAGGFGFAGEGKEGKVFDEVAKELVKLKRSYSLEMNSF